MTKHECTCGHDHHSDPLAWQERDSLTVWARAFTAQARDLGGMVIYFPESAERSPEDGKPYVLSAGDVEKLRELLNEMEKRRAAEEGGAA